MTRKLGRRAILGGLGASIALPFLPSWRGEAGGGVLASRARAADDAPKRVVFWYSPWGTLPKFWTPTDGPSGSTTDWRPSEILEPLARFQSRTNVLSGVNLVSTLHQYGHRVGNHSIGASHVLGAATNQTTYPWGPDAPVISPSGATIDHVLAARLPRKRFGALVLGDTTDHLDDFQRTETGETAPQWRWPRQIYDAVFADFEGDDSAREARLLARTSVLDGVMSSYEHLRTRVSPDDRRTLDRHLDGLREVERRLGDVSVCMPPAHPTHEATYTEGPGWQWPTPEGPYDDLFGLAASTLTCDLTSVLTVRFSGDFASMRHVLPPEVWAAHAVEGADHGGVHAYSHAHWGEVHATEIWKHIQRWKMEVFGRFLDRLDAVVEENGRTVLDNTIVVHVSDMLTGLHDGMPMQEWGYSNPANGFTDPAMIPTGLPLLTVGGGTYGISTGHHHRFDRTDTYYSDTGKYSHGELYLTIARALGVGADALPTFGTPDLCRNTVDELFG